MYEIGPLRGRNWFASFMKLAAFGGEIKKQYG